jgi:hypothetical protein
MSACTPADEIVDHGAQLTELRERICPQGRPRRFAFTKTEHLHGRFTRVQHTLQQDFLMEWGKQRAQLLAARAIQATSIDRGIARPTRAKIDSCRYSGKMVGVFGNYRGE